MADKFTIPWVAGILIGLVGFIKLTSDTIMGSFFRWFPFGWGWLVWFIDPVVQYYEILIGGLVALIFLQKTKNVYILVTIALLVFLFLKFGLKAVGTG